jgi:cytochrome c5
MKNKMIVFLGIAGLSTGAFASSGAENLFDSKCAMCHIKTMPQKIARFGLMPSQKGNISDEELKAVASWMYDNYPPANFQGRGMMRKQQ